MPPARRPGRSGDPARGGQAAAKTPADGPARPGTDVPAAAAGASGEPDITGQRTTRGKRPATGARGGTKAATAGMRTATGQPSPTKRRTAKPATTGDGTAGRPATAERPGKQAAAGKPAATGQPSATKRRTTKPATAKLVTAKPTTGGNSATASRPAVAESAGAAKAATPGTRRARRTAAEPGPGPEASEPLAATQVAADAAQDTSAAASSGKRHSQLLVPAVLAVVTVLLGAFAVWSGVRAHTLRSGAAAQNTALTDNATTTRIIGQVTTAVGDIFSYSYADPARTQRAGQRDVTGQAVQQYRSLFQGLQREAARYSQLVLTTTVTDAGVEVLQGDRAEVLIFASQVLTSASQKPQSFGAMVALDLLQQGGSWKIDNIDTFTGAR